MARPGPLLRSAAPNARPKSRFYLWPGSIVVEIVVEGDHKPLVRGCVIIGPRTWGHEPPPHPRLGDGKLLERNEDTPKGGVNTNTRNTREAQQRTPRPPALLADGRLAQDCVSPCATLYQCSSSTLFQGLVSSFVSRHQMCVSPPHSFGAPR